MKPEVSVRTIELDCLCGYSGSTLYENMIQCPRCTDWFEVSCSINVINVNPAERWAEKIQKAFDDDYQLFVTTDEIMKKLNMVVTVEEYMRDKKCDEWDLQEWRGCVMATYSWLYDMAVRRGKLQKDGKIQHPQF